MIEFILFYISCGLLVTGLARLVQNGNRLRIMYFACFLLWPAFFAVYLTKEITAFLFTELEERK